MDDLQPVIQQSVETERQRIRFTRNKGELAKFSGGDYFLVAREHLYEGEQLCECWQGPRRVKKCLSDYVLKIEDLRNGNIEIVHGTRLNVYVDYSLDFKAILSHVPASQTDKQVSLLLRLVEQDGQLFVLVGRKELANY